VNRNFIKVMCCWTDIDECADASIGDKCRLHGTCDGYNPPGHYTCNCKPGYKLNTTFSESECIGNTALYTVETSREIASD